MLGGGFFELWGFEIIVLRHVFRGICKCIANYQSRKYIRHLSLTLFPAVDAFDELLPEDCQEMVASAISPVEGEIFARFS